MRKRRNRDEEPAYRDEEPERGGSFLERLVYELGRATRDGWGWTTRWMAVIVTMTIALAAVAIAAVGLVILDILSH
ncbi:MAG: hypothetical protein J2P26_14050 [Nocardiopsaceae bacterium]|nr:hypothetical protein [Nocardiopsaceae bacterium]